MILTDSSILVGVNQKNVKAWEQLYQRFYAALCSYANRIVGDSDGAQDVVQDTLIKIWRSDRIFPDMKDLTWYLYKSVYNNSLFWLRSCHSRKQLCLKVMEDDVVDNEEFAETIREELIRQLYVCIQDLPEERRKIMMLSIEGRSGNEIAEILGISINTVKTQKNRSFRYLRNKLKDTAFYLFLVF